MKLSKAQGAALEAVAGGGHISYDRFTGKYRVIPKGGAPSFITALGLDRLHAANLIREIDPRYETGTHALTDAGRTALREGKA